MEMPKFMVKKNSILLNSEFLEPVEWTKIEESHLHFIMEYLSWYFLIAYGTAFLGKDSCMIHNASYIMQDSSCILHYATNNASYIILYQSLSFISDERNYVLLLQLSVNNNWQNTKEVQTQVSNTISCLCL